MQNRGDRNRSIHKQTASTEAKNKVRVFSRWLLENVLNPSSSHPNVQRTLSIPVVPTNEAPLNEPQALEEILRKLRRDVDHLSRINHVDEVDFTRVPTSRLQRQQDPAEYRQLVPVMTSQAHQRASSATDVGLQRHCDRLYPPEFVSVSPQESSESRSESAHTDTFNPSSVWGSPNAIANKIGAIRGAMLSEWFLNESMFAHGNKTIPLTLPPPSKLRQQIDLFLSEFDDYSPFFRNASLQQRISTALHSLSYSERRTTIHVTSEHCTTLAILCNIIWFAETVTASISTMDPNTGQNWFLQGKRLMEEFEDMIGDSVEVVAYHLLASGSLMEAEKLRQAAWHVVRALHTARSIGLDDKDRWRRDPEDIIAPRSLLMVLYFHDKRIHYKCGISYLLRPDDVNLEDFLPLRGEPGIEDIKLELVEAMVSYSQLWTSIWCSFLAPHAPLAGEWSEVQIADAKVVIKYQALPERLLWDTNKVQEYVVSGVTDACMRQKLQVFLVRLSQSGFTVPNQRFV